MQNQRFCADKMGTRQSQLVVSQYRDSNFNTEIGTLYEQAEKKA